MASFKHRIEFGFFKLALLLLKNKSPEKASLMGARFGEFLYNRGLRKSIVLKNLEVAFGDQYDEEKREDLALSVYKNVGSTMFEFLKMKFIEPEEIGKYIEIEGLEILKDAVEQNRGVVMAGFHFGNWELMSAGTCQMGLPVYGYVGQQRNPLVDDEINKIRTKFGMRAISKGKSAPREMIKALKNKEVLVIGSDLNVPSRNLFVEFFGTKAAVGQGQATFINKLKTPYLIFYAERTGPFRYKGHIEKIDYELDQKGVDNTQYLIQLASNELERIVRKFPDQYFWFNRRWKTRPEGEESIY